MDNPNYFKTNGSFQNKLMNILCSLFTWKHESLEKSQTFFATGPAPSIEVLISDEQFFAIITRKWLFLCIVQGMDTQEIR